MTNSKIEIPEDQLFDICRRNQIKRLALFGSVLKDEFNSDSDVDLLVLFDPQAKIGFMALGRMKREFSELFQRPVDLVPQNGLKPLIREQVLASAEEIYAA